MFQIRLLSCFIFMSQIFHSFTPFFFYSYTPAGCNLWLLCSRLCTSVSTHTPLRGVTIHSQNMLSICHFYSYTLMGRNCPLLYYHYRSSGFYSYTPTGCNTFRNDCDKNCIGFYSYTPAGCNYPLHSLP